MHGRVDRNARKVAWESGGEVNSPFFGQCFRTPGLEAARAKSHGGVREEYPPYVYSLSRKRGMQKLLLHGRFRSSCCGARTVLVRSRSGGFITQNCEDCERPNYIRLDELPLLQCPHCSADLIAQQRRNYCYVCPLCGMFLDLPLFIPAWYDLFEERGFGFPSERCEPMLSRCKSSPHRFAATRTHLVNAWLASGSRSA